ncbi:glycoside hydrolase family 27 protein [Streptomyces sp. PTM05]|uniref:Alpha-galactosidase n=1 Tax=Streptantibioticus parmotrematis TaxID=2873249 RepID=A0ABS7QNM9_9ACTN|nr:glycoside hydrolase family 27 protein [Streptantibioticus parmotrematis]MBY8883472.1 glycoside hydrolase family 27 protein [Streptantibioticus parmotrematis]
MIHPSRKRLAHAITTTLAVGGLALTAALPAQAAPATPAAHTAPPKAGNTSPAYNGLALTPPMGWNDWSYYQCNISEQLILDQAKALVSTGLAKKGYNTVTIDDCWMAKSRDRNGNLVGDSTKFPDGMAYVGSQLHKMGLKFGIYEDAGTETCGGYPGSWGHETADAKRFASWGVDYLKLDGCNVPSVQGQSDEETYREEYQKMSQALLDSGRKIVFSESAPAYFQGTPDWYKILQWTPKYGNLWREGWDIALGQDNDKWSSIMANYGYNVPLGAYSGPGHWNDPDFLLAGDSGLTADETQSQVVLWAEMAAPLISSTDLTKLSPSALAILGNADVIAVDQDPAGVQGHQVYSDATYDVLVKPLAGGDKAVVFLNKSAKQQTFTIGSQELGYPAGAKLAAKDLISKTTTPFTSSVSATVPAHGTVMYRVHTTG